MHFGLQVGWPALAALAVTLHGLAARRPGLRLCRGSAGRLAVFFLLALVLVWTPFDFWRFLPHIFEFIQFSYRLLLFVVLFGSLLAGHALKLALGDRMRFEHAVAALLGLGVFVSPYLRPHHSPTTVDLGQEIAQPNIGRGGANGVYLLSLQVIHEHMHRRPCPAGFGPVWRAHTRVPIEVHPGHPTRLLVTSPGRCFIQLPVLYYPRLLDVRVDGRPAPYYAMGHQIALPLGPGPHEVHVRFVGLRWANRLSQALWVGVLLGLGGLAWRRRRAGQPAFSPRAGSANNGGPAGLPAAA
jgi:hypothetical protein